MHRDPHALAQMAAVMWLAVMGSLLCLAPKVGLPSPETPAEVFAAGLALALLLAAAAYRTWRNPPF